MIDPTLTQLRGFWLRPLFQQTDPERLNRDAWRPRAGDRIREMASIAPSGASLMQFGCGPRFIEDSFVTRPAWRD